MYCASDEAGASAMIAWRARQAAGATLYHPRSEDRAVIGVLIKVGINAAALYAAIQLVPGIRFDYGDAPWKLAAVAAVFAVINTYIKPIVKLIALPISLLTMGLVAFVINAAMLLLLAYFSAQLKLDFTVGGYPPDFGLDSAVAAIQGAVIIGVVSTALGLVDLTRKVVGIR